MIKLSRQLVNHNGLKSNCSVKIEENGKVYCTSCSGLYKEVPVVSGRLCMPKSRSKQNLIYRALEIDLQNEINQKKQRTTKTRNYHVSNN